MCKGCGETYDPGQDLHLCYLSRAGDLEDAPTLVAAMTSDAFVRGVVGPVGSGKSSWAVTEIVRRGQEMPKSQDGIRHSRGVIIRNTYGQLRDTTRATFEQWFPEEICEWHEADFTCDVRFGDVHIEVLFRALDRPDDIAKLLSLELTWAFINEAREVPKPVFDMVTARVGRFPSRGDVTTDENRDGTYWHGVWFDTNPCDTDHWLYKNLEENKARRRCELESGQTVEYACQEKTFEVEGLPPQTVALELYHQPGGLSKGAENRRNLQPGYYERQMLGKDEDWVNVNVHSKWGFVKEGKPVFPEYNDTLHCRAVDPHPALPILIGMDFGLTPAAVLAQRAGGHGQLQVFDELVSDDMGAVAFAKELKRYIQAEYPGRPVRGWGDPAGEQRAQTDERTPFDVVQEAGLPVDAAPTNDERRRLEAVKGLLTRLTMGGQPALIIDPKAKVLRKALGGGYCRARVKVSGDERFQDKPAKNRFSHVADALQYLCVGEGEDTRAIHGATQRKVKPRVKVHRAFGAGRRWT